MRAMQIRTEAQGLALHEALEPRIYTGPDMVHGERIRKSLAMAKRALEGVSGRAKRVFEVGCGTCDIVGPLTEDGWEGRGIECNAKSIREAMLRFNSMRIIHGAILGHVQESFIPSFALVIMCEILEHLPDPMHVATSYLADSERSLISHPLDEPLDSAMSAGEHVWSFSREDHESFFKAGGHAIDETAVEVFGGFKFLLSRGHRI